VDLFAEARAFLLWLVFIDGLTLEGSWESAVCCEIFLRIGKSSIISKEFHDLIKIRQGVAAVELHLYIDRPDVCEL